MASLAIEEARCELHQLATETRNAIALASPLGAMRRGKLERLDEWEDFSQEGADTLAALWRDLEARALAVDPQEDPSLVALRGVIVGEARSWLLSSTWESELLQLNPRIGLWETVLGMADGYPLATAQHGQDYVTKLRRLPAALDQLSDVVVLAADQGRVSLRRHLEETARSIAAYVADGHGPGDRLCAQPAPTDLDEAEQELWRFQRDRVVVEEVTPALGRFAEWLMHFSARGMPDELPGLVHLEGGLEVYRGRIWANLQRDMEPQEIHDIGLAQVDALEDEYRAMAAPILGTSEIDEIYDRLRSDTSMRYGSAAAIIADAERALARAQHAVSSRFRTIPQSPCHAVATDHGPMAYYSDGDPETGKQARFFFKTVQPQAWSTYELEAITFHEAIPGHHMQSALAAENTALHPLQREVANAAYAEGWGLYAERLADEMGLYSSDVSRLGMLSADSLRACRLVVDTGIHAFGWSRQQAVDYVYSHSPMDREHIEQEVDRYIGLPGQALAYMIGRLEIQDLRAEAERRPGFDIRDFHDAVLRHGAVPLSTLRRLVLG